MDRRAHPRKPCLLKVYLRQERRTWEGTIINYSETGVFVAAREAVKLGDEVQLRFRRPSDTAVIEVDGWVRRVVMEPGSLGGDTGYGIQLLELLTGAATSKGASGVFRRPSNIELEPLSATPTPQERPDGKTRDGSPSADPAAVSASRARDTRFVAYIKTTFTPMTGREAPRDGEIVNINRQGLYLSTDHPPSLDSVLSVRIDGWDVDGSSRPLDLIVQVVSRQPAEGLARRPPGTDCRVIGFGNTTAESRFESLLRARLVVGNPIMGK